MRPLALTFTKARTLRAGGFDELPLSIDGGIVTDVRSAREVALPGATILPGIIDLHGDGFERHLAPRRGLIDDPARGLLALDSELAAAGITTAVLAQFWSWEGGMRGPAFARKLAQALKRARPQLLTDMRLQLRLETHLIDEFDEVAEFVEAEDIRYVVFNDHLPHEALAKGRRPPRLTGQALKSGRSPEAHLALIQALAARAGDVPDALSKLAATLRARGVRLGSHDDRDGAQRAVMRALGATIAEFPETMDAAQAAKDAGDPVILGAPNVVRGGSHTGNMAARAAVAKGLCDALVSDYHYPSLVAAVSAIATEGVGLDTAWNLVSHGPAQVLGLDDRGALSPGMRADFAVLGSTGRVEAVINAGRIAFASGEVAHALIG